MKKREFIRRERRRHRKVYCCYCTHHYQKAGIRIGDPNLKISYCRLKDEERDAGTPIEPQTVIVRTECIRANDNNKCESFQPTLWARLWKGY